MTQREIARKAAREIRTELEFCAKSFLDLEDAVLAAQNGPPDGAGDGSFDEDSWFRAKRLVDALKELFHELNIQPRRDST